jgi:hypothetical protein
MAIETATQWAETQFGQAELGDPRRNRRLLALATEIAERPGLSINALFPHQDAARAAAYRFMDSAHVPPEALIHAAGKGTAQRIQGLPDPLFLALCDSTPLKFSHPAVYDDVGPLSTQRDTKNPGFWVHNVLLTTLDRIPLGLLHQDYWARDRTTHGKRQQRATRSYTEKESYKWEKAIRAADEHLEENDRSRVIYVCDREADIYEFLAFLVTTNKRFVVRVNGNRSVLDSKQRLLWQAAQAGPVVGTQTVSIPQRGGRPARDAQLQIRAGTVSVKPPGRLGKKALRLGVQYVYAVESPPPDGVAPLEWLLLTCEPVSTLAESSFALEAYRSRWTVEEFHKVWKQVGRAERQRLQSGAGLLRLSILLAQASTRVMAMRSLAAAEPEAPSTEVLTELETKCLVIWASQQKVPQPQGLQPSAKWAYQTIGRLGGWNDTKRTGRVGLQKFWEGWRRLQHMKEMIVLFQGIEINEKLV